MGRRAVAGRDPKITQGHRRDAFFAKLRRKGGGRPGTQAPPVTSAEGEEAGTPAEIEVDSAPKPAGTESEVAAEDEGKDLEAAAAP